MLAAIRRFAKSWVALLLIGLLIVSFAIFGINDVFQTTASDAVIQAGDRKVTGPEFRRAFETQRQQLEQQYGQPISAELAAQNGIDRQLLQQMADGQALGGFLERIGLRPSGRLITEELQEMPQFFDPITGAFDRESYVQLLARNNATPADFEKELSDGIARQHLGSAIAAGFQAPRAYAALNVLFLTEQRDVGYLVLTPSNVPAPPAPTDAQLTQLMNENRARLTRPEYRVLSLVRFTPQTVTVNRPITDAEIQKRYEYRKDTAAKPETRSLVQIPARDAAAAQQIAERLRKGEDPAAVAKALRVEAVTYEDKPRTAISDRKVADAAFALQAGQVSAPIQGDLGLAVVKVTKVTPGQQMTLEQLRPLIEAELRQEAAAQAAYDQSTVFEEAHAGGAPLAEAAKKAGAQVVTVGPVSAQGADPQGQPVQGVSKPILDDAFELPAGGESDLKEAGEGEYYAVRVEKIIPSALPPLAEVRDVLAQEWTRRQLVAALEARAGELAGRIRKGEMLEAVAASAGARVSRAVGLDRRSAAENPTAPQQFVAQVFDAKPNEVFTVALQSPNMPGPAVAVGKLEAVRPPAPAQAAQFTAMARSQMGPPLFEDIVGAVQRLARERMKVRINADLARSALGLEPLPKDGKGEAEKSK